VVASTLGGEEPVGAGEHEHADEEGEFLHPWAREMYKKGLSFNGNERNKLFLRGADGFEDQSDLCGADSPLDGRGLIACDFDHDGDLDLFVHNIQRERHNLFRNEVNRAGYLKLRLRGKSAHYEAIGATVVVHGPHGPVAQVLSRGAGYGSCQAPELVFGCGDREYVQVDVAWPGGVRERFERVPTGGAVLLVEGAQKAQPVPLKATQLAEPLPLGLKLGIGERVPKLTLLDAAGERQELDLAALTAEDSVLLSFWASYCRPCVEEIPELERRHNEDGTRVIAVSVDVPSARPRAQELLDARRTTYPAYFLSLDDQDNEDRIDEVIDLVRLPIPTTLVLGPGGRIEAVLRGALEAADD